jgi:hypothetical protein
MKKLLWACVLGLPFLALPTEAKAFGLGGYDIDCGAKVWCDCKPLNFHFPQAGPWYLYWPYWAHFQSPAYGVSPYFPQPMGLPPGFGQAPAPPPAYRPPMPAPAQGAAPPAPHGPMGYYYAPPAAPTYPVGYYYYGR